MKIIFAKNNKKKRLIFKVNPFIDVLVFLIVFTFSLILLYQQPTKVLATIPNYTPQDSCGLVNINFASTGPNCSVFSTDNGSCQNPAGNPTNPNINSQTLTVTLSSNDGRAHQVSYFSGAAFCTNGYLNTAFGYCSCNDNEVLTNQIITVPAGKSVPITTSESPTTGSDCGSYQIDFTVTAVDGNTGCNSGNTTSNVGGSLTCETGITCSAAPPPPPPPPPNCTTTPTTCSACAAPANTCSNGNGTQTCTLSQPQACTPVAIQQSCTLNNCTGGNICTNQACVPPTYTISGNVFDDYNKNGLIDNGETNYNGPITIQSSKGQVATTANGNYTITGIPAGSDTISYASLPATYSMTSPINGPPSSYTVTVGGACNTNGAKGATCNGGNITNINFGITNLNAWWQSTCSDVREQGGIIDLLSAGATALVSNANCTNTPGIIFTGNTNANVGQGQGSATNQIVGGASYPEVYSPQSGILYTAYSSLLAKAQNASITPTNLASECNITNCTLPANLAHGIYLANGNTTLNAFTFPANQNYVVLINGNLTINGAITVPVGSTALFASSGNITVSPTVGAAAAVVNPSLSGWYVAGQSFVLPTQGNCNDLRLNVAGSVVVDAEGNGGTFQNNRDLCGGDQNDPTISFSQRLDFILNAPQFIQQQQTISHEVSP